MKASTVRTARILAAFAVPALVLLPTAASAYVGPGAGLSLLGALWALIVAVGLAVAFIVAWPIRRMMRRRKQASAPVSGQTTARMPPRPAETRSRPIDDTPEPAGTAGSRNL